MRPEGRSGPSGVPVMDLEAELRAGIQALDLVLSDRQVGQLLDFLALLRKWNAVYNLTAVRDPGAMLTQHVLDSLAVVQPLRRYLALDRALIADVGSGAGVPGLVLGIVLPQARILSIEPVGKKIAFQRQVSAELALTNVEIYAGRAEAVHRPVDLLISRAFASLADFRHACLGLIAPHTLLSALKGQRSSIEAETRTLPAGSIVELCPLAVPGLKAERHLVVVRPAPLSNAAPSDSPTESASSSS